MKNLSYYKLKAKEIAKKDIKSGFKFHILRNPFSNEITKLLDQMAIDGYNKNFRDQIELQWENSLSKLQAV
jgi:hypothetical protein